MLNPEKTYESIQQIKRQEIQPPVEEDIYRFQHDPTYGENIVVIPARSGSTRLRDKNIASLNGLPLLAYTILLAGKLEGVDRVLVATDSSEYAQIAREHGAEAPILRPAFLAGETSPLSETVQFFIDYVGYIEKKIPNMVITMLPTNPFRNLCKASAMLALLKKHTHIGTHFRVDVDLTRIALKSSSQLQFSTPFSNLAGQPFIKSIGVFNGLSIYNKLRMKKSVAHFEISNPIEMIDIDTKEDLHLAGTILKNDLYDFGFTLN